MPLTDRIRNFYDSTRKNLIRAGSIAAIVTSTYAQPSRAGDIYVDPTWMSDGTPTLINNILDGNPETLGKDSQTDAQAGDTVHFAEGTYQLPMQQGVNFKLRVDEVDIQGAGWDNTLLRGASPNSGTIWQIYSSDNTLSHFQTENSFVGMVISGEDFNNITFSNVLSINHHQHYAWPQQNADSETNTPSINVDHCYLIGGNTGFQFNKLDGATPNTKYLGGANITIDGLNAIGINAPIVWEGGQVVEMKGNDDFFDTIIINTDAPFIEEAYEGMNSPQGFVEWWNGSESLFVRGIGIYNIEENPLLDGNGMPLPGSPAIGPQYGNGYAGAVPPGAPTNLKRTPSTSNRRIIPP